MIEREQGVDGYFCNLCAHPFEWPPSPSRRTSSNSMSSPGLRASVLICPPSVYGQGTMPDSLSETSGLGFLPKWALSKAENMGELLLHR